MTTRKYREPFDDQDVLDVQCALKRLGGKKRIYVTALSHFSTQIEYTKAHEIIAGHLAADDRVAASQMAHSIKGAATTIGAVNLARITEELETAIKDESQDIDDSLKKFKSQLEQTQEAINRFLETEN
jgi:two-component system, sensor histidine kinase and response regulator